MSNEQQKKVLVIGGGGREHALAWKLSQSQRVSHVFVAPGNAGTATSGSKISNVAISELDFSKIVSFCKEQSIDLVVVGPELPLASGISNLLAESGIKFFGPSKEAAQIESSKAFAKDFMSKYSIPTAQYATFTDYEKAAEFIKSADFDVVLKASGLCSGKGVLLPSSKEEAIESLKEFFVDKKFGSAGEQVVIEERLVGEEISLIALSDGTNVKLLPPARDYKRLNDNDQGPNTGGMGAVAPVKLGDRIEDAVLLTQIKNKVILPTVNGLRAEGTPFVGALYAGLILTEKYGPMVLEFNCRFGDPETQVLMPLIDTDIFELFDACVNNKLGSTDLKIKPNTFAVAVVGASQGYPQAPSPYAKGKEITLNVNKEGDVIVFHAGTALVDDDNNNKKKVVTSGGGRVFAAVATGSSLADARNKVYENLESNNIGFEGMHYRRDIAAKPVPLVKQVNRKPAEYADAGVDIEAGDKAVEMMKAGVKSTYGPEVLMGIGAYGGLFDIGALVKKLEHPCLVASTDGVGTKTKIAVAYGKYDTIGQDIVNHCVNDILVQGARPLFFLDYVASNKLDPIKIATIVNGCAKACKENGCAILGGETAEMPSVYQPNELDLAGTIVGVVDRNKIIDGSTLTPGDQIVALPSSGLHTNGYSLARFVLQDFDLHEDVDGILGKPLGEALLAPHRAYLKEFDKLVEGGVEIKGMAHITGGGLIDNPPRIFAPNIAIRIRRRSWIVPPLFRLIQAAGNIGEREMCHVFNMGIGMMFFVAAGEQTQRAMEILGEEAMLIGEVISRAEGGEPVEFDEY